MGKLERTLRSEILGVVRKELRPLIKPLGRELRALRRTLLRSLKRTARGAAPVGRRGRRPRLAPRRREGPPRRRGPQLRADRITRLREKLGLTQKQLGALIGVSVGTVVGWEKARFVPKADKVDALLELKKLGKRKVKKLLIEKGIAKIKKRGLRKVPRTRREKGIKEQPPAQRATAASKEQEIENQIEGRRRPRPAAAKIRKGRGARGRLRVS